MAIVVLVFGGFVGMVTAAIGGLFFSMSVLDMLAVYIGTSLFIGISLISLLVRLPEKTEIMPLA